MCSCRMVLGREDIQIRCGQRSHLPLGRHAADIRLSTRGSWYHGCFYLFVFICVQYMLKSRETNILRIYINVVLNLDHRTKNEHCARSNLASCVPHSPQVVAWSCRRWSCWRWAVVARIITPISHARCGARDHPHTSLPGKVHLWGSYSESC